jgi:hypothetical protein
MLNENPSLNSGKMMWFTIDNSNPQLTNRQITSVNPDIPQG